MISLQEFKGLSVEEKNEEILRKVLFCKMFNLLKVPTFYSGSLEVGREGMWNEESLVFMLECWTITDHNDNITLQKSSSPGPAQWRPEGSERSAELCPGGHLPAGGRGRGLLHQDQECGRDPGGQEEASLSLSVPQCWPHLGVRAGQSAGGQQLLQHLHGASAGHLR